MLRKVIQDERRHFAFYRAQAKARMERSPHGPPDGPLGADRSLWTPVGAGVKTRGGGRRARRSTCSATAPRAASRSARSTDTIADLPGLGGLTIVEDYLDAALAPGGRAAGLGGHRPAASGGKRQRPCSVPPALGGGRGARGLAVAALRRGVGGHRREDVRVAERVRAVIRRRRRRARSAVDGVLPEVVDLVADRRHC